MLENSNYVKILSQLQLPLGWQFNDVELLLPVSSTHTPAVGEKYGIGFF